MIVNRADSAQLAVRRISWAAIFAGLVVTLAVSILLNLLGVGVGASTVHVESGDGASAGAIGTGSTIWFVISTLISLFAGGWVAGRLAGIPQPLDGVLHGVATWSIATIVTLYLLTTTVGSVLGGASGLLGNVLGAAGNGLKAAAPGISQTISQQAEQNGVSVDSVTEKAQQLLRETGKSKLSPEALKAQAKHLGNSAKASGTDAAQNPQSADSSKNDLIYKFLHDGDATAKAADRTALINVVASEQNVSKAQAAKTVDQWAQEAQSAQQQADKLIAQGQEKAKQAADATAAGVSKAAIGAFFLMLLGAIAAAVGGLVSSRQLIAENIETSGIATRTTTGARL